ncbi:GNAT family N-acetyltransferase [Streptococcus ruminantium]|uniref:GNAT family N-acetyltransferase n=1 Tax=Streptococcus ruminantium TaxID=1917441 RepID=UPI002351A303|nr:GNAT family N-acetyltransferase [Streptococcus ruminantium]
MVFLKASALANQTRSKSSKTSILLKFNRNLYSSGKPQGFYCVVEGIWVHPDYRQRGIAGQLLVFAEKWARTMGASQPASDADIDNVISQAFHIKNGFKEVSRTVHYVRNLVVDKE